MSFPCQAHLTPAEGVTVNLCTRHHFYDFIGIRDSTKGSHVMKITEQFAIAWIRNEEASADELVAVHSRPISSSDADAAWRQFENGKAIDGFIASVFVDEQRTLSELRSWLEAEARHEWHLIR